MIGGARTFVFRPGVLDFEKSTMTFTFTVEMLSGSTETYIDVIEFPGVPMHAWESVSKETIRAFCEDLSLAFGSIYWKINCARDIKLDGFSITQEQADFWKELYEKSLAEFFYLSRIDYRGLISFPADAKNGRHLSDCPRQSRSLVALGGGKDSIVTAEAFKRLDIPFDTLLIGSTQMQERVAQMIGKPIVRAIVRHSPLLQKMYNDRAVLPVGPRPMALMFISVFLGVVLDYRYTIFSNEHSADFPNLTYLGVPVNHQWTKSTEAEVLARRYVATYLTRDVVSFSPLHQYSEAFLVREFAQYPQYFPVFSSCNWNFLLPYSPEEEPNEKPAYWCGACPKCLFIFACLSAFLPKETVVKIFGKNVYADASLLPYTKQLLGLEGSKPFECVGTAEEMSVVMMLARQRGEYAHDAIMQWFDANVHISEDEFARLKESVFSIHGEGTTPAEFAQEFLHKPLFSKSDE